MNEIMFYLYFLREIVSTGNKRSTLKLLDKLIEEAKKPVK